jgi:hypothetical protein
MGLNSVNTWIQATDRANLANGYTLSLNPNGGNVGIGIASPTAKLHIEAPDNTDLMRFTVTGNEMWAFKGASAAGSNDTVSFGIAGGTQAMAWDESGIVTTPYQPNFLARIPSGSVAITSNAWATFNFNSTALGWDKGGNFTSSTKRFTAPVAGVYFFQWLIQVESITDAPTWYYAYPTVNGSGSFGTTNGMSAADQVEPVGVYHAMKGTQSLQLAASDYVEMRYFWDNGNGNLKGGGESMWAGHLIG